MAEMTSYAHGVPSWADLGTTDQTKTAAFYCALFGWEVQDLGPDAGGYQMATYKGKPVVGLGSSEGGPMYWTTYINVDSTDDIAERVTKAGGTTLLEPMDAMTAGRMAIFADPTGAIFGVWQPRDHKGAELVNETNTMCWNELSTRDTATAAAFYTDVFGWTPKPLEDGPPGGYTQWEVEGRAIAGMMQTPAEVPAEVPANWMVYFTVDDPDATAAKAQKLGGTLLAGPIEMPSMRFHVLAGPHGEAFSVIRFAEQPA